MTIRVLVTREDPAPLAEAIARAGGEPILMPLLRTRWLDGALPPGRTLEDYDWVAFTSVHGVEGLGRLAEANAWTWPPEVRAAAVGGRTADELQACGWMPECIAADSTARGLVDCMSERNVFGARVLFPASAIAEPTLPEGLRRAGAHVDVVAVYTTETAWSGAPERMALLGRDLRESLAAGCVATCASPSAARALSELAAAAGCLDALRRTLIAVIGPTTAAAVTALGLRAVEAPGKSLACLARRAVEIGAD